MRDLQKPATQFLVKKHLHENNAKQRIMKHLKLQEEDLLLLNCSFGKHLTS
jgi:hypothetical protein